MKRGIVWLCMSGVVLIISCGEICADVIKFKDKTWITGKIIAETDNVVMVQTKEGVKKISKKDIQEITKASNQMTGAETTKARLRINDIGKIPISDLESGIDAWLQKLKPLHQRQAIKLIEAQKASRLGKMGAVYVWLSWWCKNGSLLMGEDNLDGTITILGQCETKLRKDIDFLSKRHLCRYCHGSGFKDCSKCGGRGVIVQYKKWRVTDLETSRIKTKAVTNKCITCKGKGKEPCVYNGSRWKLCHEPEKRMKKISSLDKMVEIEIAVKKHRSALNTIKNEARQSDAERLRKLAERCRREGYYYMTLEILKRIKGEEKK